MQASEPSRLARVPLVAWGLLSALLFALIWPPIGWWWCSFVAIAPLVLVARRARSARAAFLIAGLTQVPAWLLLQYWLVQLTPPGMALLVLYCSLYVGVFAVVLRRVDRVRWPAAISVPIVWTAVEHLRTTLVLGGYPWFPLGLGLIGPETGDAPFGHAASLFGTPVLSFIAASVSGAVVDLVSRAAPGSTSEAPRSRFARAIGPLVAASLALADLLYGAYVLRSTAVVPGPRVLVVQTDLSVSNKEAWSRQDQERDFADFIRASYEGAELAMREGQPIDVVAWPETMVPGFGLEPEATAMLVREGLYPMSHYLDGLVSLSRAIRAPLLVGSAVYLGLTPDDATQRWEWTTHYNSAYLVDGTPPFQRYDKLVLTPFGEVMPLISRWEWLEQKLLSLSAPGMTFDLEPGAAPVRFEVAARGGGAPHRVVTPICFEATIASVCRQLCYQDGRRVADLMVNLSNDGWFGWNDAGRQHHVLHARLRTLELGVPMIRCANTGRSVAIEWTGRVSDEIPTLGSGTGTMTKPMTPGLTNRSTLYGVVGDIWPWTTLAATAALLLVAGRAKRR